jgi:osmotically-inducible protein OsmY
LEGVIQTVATVTATGARTDTAIRDDVQFELKYDPKITSTDIGVAVKDQVVTLTDYVSSYWEKEEAEKAAKRVYGARAVANDLQVKLAYLTRK